MRITRPGWRFAPDAYRSLGELTCLAGGLPQAFQQIMEALRCELELNLIKMDVGGPYEDNPAGAVEAASVALERATEAARQMYTAEPPPRRCTHSPGTCKRRCATPGIRHPTSGGY